MVIETKPLIPLFKEAIVTNPIEVMKQEIIAEMRSRVTTAKPPFGNGMEIRVLISAFDLIEALDPHALIDQVIENAKYDLHVEWDRLASYSK